MATIKQIRKECSEIELSFPVYKSRNGEWYIAYRLDADSIPSRVLRKVYEQGYELYHTADGVFAQYQEQGAKYFIERF